MSVIDLSPTTRPVRVRIGAAVVSSASNMKTFWALFIASMALASVGFAAGWVVSFTASIWIALLWVTTVLLALFSFRKRALWMLVGAPLAVYWPFVFFVACREFGAFC